MKKSLGLKARQFKSFFLCFAFVLIFSLPVSVLAATTVGNDVSVGGTLGVTGVTTLTAALVANGAVTLGDTVGDAITITGKLGTIYVSDGSNTSTLAKTSFTVGEASGYNLGKFYVDGSTGNVFATGTLAIVGATTLTGALVANGAVTLGDAAADLTTLGGYFNVMTVGDLTSTSTLTKNTLAVGAVAADVLGKFYVNSAGNVSVSSSLYAFGNVTSTGILYTTNGLIASASSTFASNLMVTGALNTSSTLQTTGGLTIYGNTTLGDSNAAGTGDTTQVYGSMAIGVAPTGNAQLFIRATSTGDNVLTRWENSSGSLLGSFSSSTNAILTGPGGQASVYNYSLLTLGSPTLLGGMLRLNSKSTNESGAIVFVDSTGAIRVQIDTNGDVGRISLGGSVTSTLTNSTLTIGQASLFNSGKFYVDGSDGSVKASGTIQTLQSTATSTIIIDSSNATPKGTCFVVKDVAGTTKYMTILTGNTIAISTTVDCRN